MADLIKEESKVWKNILPLEGEIPSSEIEKVKSLRGTGKTYIARCPIKGCDWYTIGQGINKKTGRPEVRSSLKEHLEKKHKKEMKKGMEYWRSPGWNAGYTIAFVGHWGKMDKEKAKKKLKELY